VLCQCMAVSEREVVRAIRSGARTVDEVGMRCEAGTGCGSCRGGIEVLITTERSRRRRQPVPEAVLRQLGLFGGKE
jgi:NAD(P)H-nitrite reductase large subunit